MNGSTTKRVARTEDEVDVFSRSRKVMCWTQRPGACRRVKRAANRKERQAAKNELRSWGSL